MINTECYAKNWNSNVCSHKCELFNQCCNTWIEYSRKKFNKTPINLSYEEVIKLLVDTDEKYYNLWLKIKEQREHTTPINLSENDAIMLIDYDF